MTPDIIEKFLVVQYSTSSWEVFMKAYCKTKHVNATSQNKSAQSESGNENE